MVDELYDRGYQAARADLNAHASSALAALARSLNALHRIEWSAPWASKSNTARRA